MNGANDKKTEYGFGNIPAIKSIATLKKRFFQAYVLKYRKAVIYHGDDIVFKAIDGVDVTNKEIPSEYFGKDISRFKLRIYTTDKEKDPLPFYSNTILEDISHVSAYYDMINRYVKGTFRKIITIAIIYEFNEAREQIEIARFQKDWKTGYINEYRNKGFTL